ncbi:MAG: PucR family transcriptional regulator ligand-binding domain-containing protein, partial [Sporosarcina sp.]
MNELKLTVKDILERDLFKYAKVIAGKEGLDRKVRWSHILEVKEFESLINGGELILTTGVGLQLDLPTQLMYVKKLIEKGAACICIEMGSYFMKIPIELIKLADEHDFPIIVFEKVVKFVDITQDLHTLIVNQHHKMLSQLDKLSREFIELSLSSNGILKILKELYHYFQQSVLFITDSVKPYYYPAETKELEGSIRNYLDSSKPNNPEKRLFTIDNKTFALMPVRGLGQVWGNLCLQVKESLPDEFFFLVLDRAALAIAQILLRNRTIEERKQNLEDEFVRNLLNGQHYEIDDLQTFLPSASRNLHYRVFRIQMNNSEMNWSEN